MASRYSSKSGEAKGTVQGQIKAVDRKVDYILAVMVGVIIVLFVGFITLLVMVAQMMLTYPTK